MQKGFLNGSVDVIVATKAFGLGINKRGVRTIIHDGPPGDLNSYVQEMGRAGRGETPAWCTLLCSSGQLTACERDGSAAPKTARFREFLQLDGCRWAFLRESFGESSRHALPSLRPACTPAPPVPLVSATPDGCPDGRPPHSIRPTASAAAAVTGRACSRGRGTPAR